MDAASLPDRRITTLTEPLAERDAALIRDAFAQRVALLGHHARKIKLLDLRKPAE